MTNKQPTLGFICPRCNHGMRSVCDSCEEEAAQEAGRKAVREQASHQAHREEMRKIQGYLELEGVLCETFGAPVAIDTTADWTKGTHAYYVAQIRYGTPSWLWASSGPQATPTKALVALWRNTVKELRRNADRLESLLKVKEFEEEARG